MEDASDIVEKLYARAQLAYQQAYVPYSDFRVGAAVLAANGEIYCGCNVENAAYPEGLCAEAAALAAMVLAGQRRAEAVLIFGLAEVTPCGGCRQKLREFSSAQLRVYMAGPKRIHRVSTLAELLPQSFGPENLFEAAQKS